MPSRSEMHVKKKKLGLITRSDFYDKHKACPDCNNIHLVHTLVGVVEYDNIDFVDSISSAKCKCGWRGKIIDLIEPLKEN